MKNRYKASIALAAILAASSGFAEENSGWNKSAEVGLLMTTGNSDTTNFNFKIAGDTENEQWRHKVSAEAYYAEEDGDETAEKYVLSGKTDYKLPKTQFLFLTGTYEDDRFSGYEYQFSVAAGYGRRLLAGDNWYVDGEIGPGVRYTEYQSGGDETEGLIRLALNGKWKISETSTFKQLLSTEIGEENTISKSVSELSMQIQGNLAFKAAYEVKHQSDVPDGTEKTDTKTTFNLVYGF